MPFSVQSKGPGIKGTLVRIRTEISRREVKVGVFGQADRRRGEGKSRIGNVELAAIHEYGAPRANIPARSFIYSTLHANRDEYRQIIGKLTQRVIREEMDIGQALNLLGLKVSNDCKTRISEGKVKQDLSPATLRRKQALGRAGEAVRALIASSQLKNSITYLVQLRGGGK